MAGKTKESGTMSYFEKGVEAMLLKLGDESTDEAEDLRKRAIAVRETARSWTPDTSVEEKKKATDELFTLFRTIMDRK